METKDKINYGSIGILLTLIIGLGINVMPEDTHYSNTLNMTMHCERLSNTGLTCYPHTDDKKDSKYSESGWIPIIEDSVQVKDVKGLKYKCDAKQCIIIE